MAEDIIEDDQNKTEVVNYLCDYGSHNDLNDGCGEPLHAILPDHGVLSNPFGYQGVLHICKNQHWLYLPKAYPFVQVTHKNGRKQTVILRSI